MPKGTPKGKSKLKIKFFLSYESQIHLQFFLTENISLSLFSHAIKHSLKPI